MQLWRKLNCGATGPQSIAQGKIDQEMLKEKYNDISNIKMVDSFMLS